MTDEQMNVYKMRISQAGIGEMTLIMLEMEMQWIREALDAYGRCDIEEFVTCVDKAQSVQVELMNVLNTENKVAVDVFSVFAHINKVLIEAKIKREPLDMERCRKLLERYHKSFQAVAKTDTEV